MTLNDYLCRRAGNEPDAMIIHGTPRTVYRDYKGRGVLVAVGPDTYDVVRATTETDIETLYTRGDYERWRWDGKDVHRVEVEPMVTAGPALDLLDTRPSAHRVVVTPETLHMAEELGFEPGTGDVLLWALRAAEGWREERQRSASLAATADRYLGERNAACDAREAAVAERDAMAVKLGVAWADLQVMRAVDAEHLQRAVRAEAERDALHRWQDEIVKLTARAPGLPWLSNAPGESAIEDVPALLAVLVGLVDDVEDYNPATFAAAEGGTL